MVESSSDEILEGADKTDVAFLVVGDPFGYAWFSVPAHATDPILCHLRYSYEDPAHSFLFLLLLPSPPILPSYSSSTAPPPTQTSCSALGSSPYLFTPSPTPPYSRQLAQQACSCTTSARRFPWSSSPIHGSRHRFTTALKRTLGLAFTP